MNADFAAALLDPARPCPVGLQAWNRSDPTVRMAVYRNNVISSLVDALADNCPVVQALVGTEFFRAMAAAFVRQAPPRSPVLALYGNELADFIDGFEPARAVPYLADMARLEMARQLALHAADTALLTPEAAQVALQLGEQVGELQLGWHPSVQVVRSTHAVVSIWAAHQGEEDEIAAALSTVDPDQAEDALVLRQGQDVLVWCIPPGTAGFIVASQGGSDLSDAAGTALQADPDFDLAGTLAPLLARGALTSIKRPPAQMRPRRPAP